MKIWVLHDSIYGNDEYLSRILAKELSREHEVKIGYICNIAPKSMVEEHPDMIIFGSAIRFWEHTRNLKEWFKRYVQLMKHAKRRLSYTFLYFTHVKPKTKIAKHARNAMRTLKKSGIIDNIFYECVSAKVKTIEGPLCEGVEERFKTIAKELSEWLNGKPLEEIRADHVSIEESLSQFSLARWFFHFSKPVVG